MLFLVDGGANVHATTSMDDLIYFHPKKENLTLAGDNKTISLGFGIMLVKLHPSLPPTPLVPVYLCPNTTHGILSLPALRHYNNFKTVAIHSLQHIVLQNPKDQTPTTLPTTQHNILDYLKTSILSWNNIPQHNPPSIHQLLHPTNNDQMIHQKF